MINLCDFWKKFLMLSILKLVCPVFFVFFYAVFYAFFWVLLCSFLCFFCVLLCSFLCFFHCFFLHVFFRKLCLFSTNFLSNPCPKKNRHFPPIFSQLSPKQKKQQKTLWCNKAMACRVLAYSIFQKLSKCTRKYTIIYHNFQIMFFEFFWEIWKNEILIISIIWENGKRR